MEKIIQSIKNKKEFSDLPDSLISIILTEKFPHLKTDLSKKEEKIIIKEIRKILRRFTGQYQSSTKNRKKFLEKNEITNLLKTHSSTKERMDFYPEIIEKLNSLNIYSILDLACGLNPIALSSCFRNYFASDIRQDELNLIQEFFNKNKINGLTFVLDLAHIPPEIDLPTTDCTLILKTFDLIPFKTKSERRKKINNIFEKIKSKYLIVSFPTTKISGQRMKFPKRKWFEYIIISNGYNFELFSIKNEIFYIIQL